MLLLPLLSAVSSSSSSLGKGINAIEHIVIFMQENRAFDHYYGTHRGVRGFNDRAAPVLPNGRPVFYQPVTPPKSHSLLCGCYVASASKDEASSSCTLDFSPAGADLKEILLDADCSKLAQVLGGATPPQTIHSGELCSTMMDAMWTESIEGLTVSQMLQSKPTCPAGLKISEDTTSSSADDAYILPFPLLFNTTAATCMPAPEMAYESNIHIWNGGKIDGWNTARTPGFGMSYFNRTDLPYYYALADAFTIGDQYFQSTFTATCPNREHLFSGSNGLSTNVTFNGTGFDLLDDAEPAGMTWETMGETLEAANVSWRVYQEADNFDDNGFQWFEAFKNATKGSPLFDKGMARQDDFVKAFQADVEAGTLPQVSWLVGPARLSEHASNHPQSGEDLTARILQILADPKNAKVYAKTAFILNYDEGGQFVDHHWPPTPPMDATRGASTVTTVGELTETTEFNIPAGHPIGLGWRVPFFLISPWTRGDYVYSEVCDHTSVIKFIEKRFNVTCPNISPWRRAVTGDLTAAFDFNAPNYTWPASFPDTSHNVADSAAQCAHNPPPTVPLVQSMPKQEPGTKMSRALPYKFDIVDSVDGAKPCASMNGAASDAVGLGMNGIPVNISIVASTNAKGMVCPAGAAALGDLNAGVHGDYVALCVALTPAAALTPTTPLILDIKAVLGDPSSCPKGWSGVDKHNSGTKQSIAICAQIGLPSIAAPSIVLDLTVVQSASGCANGYTLDAVNMDSGALVDGKEEHLCVLRGAPPAAATACLSIGMKHVGGEGATAGVFNVYDRSSPTTIAALPRTFTVEGAKSLVGEWGFVGGKGYDVRLHGPNGFVRMFKGDAASAAVVVRVSHDASSGDLVFNLTRTEGSSTTTWSVVDNAYGNPAQSVPGGASGSAVSAKVAIAASGNWYDVTVKSSADAGWSRRFMGRWETGVTTTSDPAMAAALPGLGAERAPAEGTHPPMHAPTYRLGQVAFGTLLEEECASRRSKTKDVCVAHALMKEGGRE
mgnify:CR=1 FL=1